MTRLTLEISVSLDGFVAGPEPSLEDPLGRNGEWLHEWAIGTRAWRSQHGMEGGAEGVDHEAVEASLAGVGATIMGRRMFSGGDGPWEDDPNPDAWWGDEPPFHHPVFVLTHHPREPLRKTGTTFEFVTGGIHEALERARAAAAGRDVHIAGGADVAQQYLRAGLVDEMTLHVAPVLLGDGRRLLDGLTAARWRAVRVEASPTGVAHVTYAPNGAETAP